MDKRQAFDAKPPIPANTANSPHKARSIAASPKAGQRAGKGQYDDAPHCTQCEGYSECRGKGGPKKGKDPIGPGSAV